MRVALVKDSKVVNTIVIESVALAEQLFPDMDSIIDIEQQYTNKKASYTFTDNKGVQLQCDGPLGPAYALNGSKFEKPVVVEKKTLEQEIEDLKTEIANLKAPKP